MINLYEGVVSCICCYRMIPQSKLETHNCRVGLNVSIRCHCEIPTELYYSIIEGWRSRNPNWKEIWKLVYLRALLHGWDDEIYVSV